MRNNAKKIITFALCLGLMASSLSLGGCSQKKDSGSSKKEAASSSQSEKKENKSSEEDKEDDGEKSSDDEKIEELEYKVDRLLTLFSNALEVEPEDILSEDFDPEEYFDYEEIHDIYDDTAVLEAYKSGDDSALDDNDKYVLEQMSQAIEENITDNMSEYEKEKAIYDYMFATTAYNDDNLAAIDLETDDADLYAHTPYGFFKYHETICVGNATTFKLFMDALGIDCKIIHSTAEGEHAWDVVNIDGNWYHVDLTFDGGDESPAYTCFNVNDEMKEEDGYDWSDQEDIPECTSLDCCYLVMSASEIEDIYAIPKAIQTAFDAGEDDVYMKIKADSEEDALRIKSEVSYILSGIIPSSSNVELIPMACVIAGDYVVCSVERYSYDDDEDYDYGDYYDGELEIDSGKLREAFKDLEDFAFDEDNADMYYF